MLKLKLRCMVVGIRMGERGGGEEGGGKLDSQYEKYVPYSFEYQA